MNDIILTVGILASAGQSTDPVEELSEETDPNKKLKILCQAVGLWALDEFEKHINDALTGALAGEARNPEMLHCGYLALGWTYAKMADARRKAANEVEAQKFEGKAKAMIINALDIQAEPGPTQYRMVQIYELYEEVKVEWKETHPDEGPEDSDPSGATSQEPLDPDPDEPSNVRRARRLTIAGATVLSCGLAATIIGGVLLPLDGTCPGRGDIDNLRDCPDLYETTILGAALVGTGLGAAALSGVALGFGLKLRKNNDSISSIVVTWQFAF